MPKANKKFTDSGVREEKILEDFCNVISHRLFDIVAKMLMNAFPSVSYFKHCQIKIFVAYDPDNIIDGHELGQMMGEKLSEHYGIVLENKLDEG